MDETNPSQGLAFKIARLVEERGWNQEDFSRIAKLNRHTARQILRAESNRRLRNATISQCAAALGISVSDLRGLPLERLLPRMHGRGFGDALVVLRERATLPELLDWLERNEARVRELTEEDIEEILEAQSPGGKLERLGVEQVVGIIERRRRVQRQVKALADTEYFALIEQFVGIVHERAARP